MIQQNISDKFAPLDRQGFEKIRNLEFRPPYDLIGLKYLRDKAGNERNLRELYRGRAPYELLQNADDTGAKRAIFILTADGLAFAHDGRWFTLDNFRSLADGWSDKDPNQCIGHKGLGFRSVLDITPAPHLLRVTSSDFLAIKFTYALNYNHVQQAIQRNQSLQSHYDKWTQHGQLVCPVMAIPGFAKKQALGTGSDIFDGFIRGKYGNEFTTMFWFPTSDPDIPQNVLKELGPMPLAANQHGRKKLLDFLKNEVSVLIPFLININEVKIFENYHLIAQTRIDGKDKLIEDGELTVFHEVDGITHQESFFQMRFALPIPREILLEPDTPKAVKALKKAQIALSLRLKEGQPCFYDSSCFHVYFPTEEITGTGFVIHADFYVTPDRKRLMSGEYNQWMLKVAAGKAANEFLTRLLERYIPRKVFEGLSPIEAALGGYASNFVSLLSQALINRKQPFVPTHLGLLTKEDAILSPTIDQEGFWESHFVESVRDVLPNKKAFLSPVEDGPKTRSFLKLAQINVLEEESLLDFIEIASEQKKAALWWYECYSFMEKSFKLSRAEKSFFIGRKLIPLTDCTAMTVPEERGLIVCFPPLAELSRLPQPDCFKRIFVFLNKEVADLIQNGDDAIKNWISNNLRIAPFAATGILPRIVRNLSPDIFNDIINITFAELKKSWSFIQNIIQSSLKSQPIEASVFWEDIGRFPVPLDGTHSVGAIKPMFLVPAFLAYFPDSYIGGENCLIEIEELKRISGRFLEELITESEVSRSEWIAFFERIGISRVPKFLTYARVIGRSDDFAFELFEPSKLPKSKFTGERQLDENKAVIETLRTEDIWHGLVGGLPSCGHESKKVLQSLSLLEGLGRITRTATTEYNSNNPRWHQRLEALVKGLPLSPFSDAKETIALCHGGGPGGHQIETTGYFIEQLKRYRWLPSTHGPASSEDCFMRFSTRRLISSGRLDFELGDKILPYVVVENIDDYAKLKHLGVEALEDVDSAESTALVRSLYMIGDRLSIEWGRVHIIGDRARWRLVRGAIQEIYRALNQNPNPLDFPSDLKLAIRSKEGVQFRPLPLYFSEPGSPVELAFKNTLPLLDADRPFPTLFDKLGIIRLESGKTVNEQFLAEQGALTASSIKDEIINGLGPFLLAPIVAKSEKSKQWELAHRKLKERFEVKIAQRLLVSFSLLTDSSIVQEIEFPKLYLQERLEKGKGAIDELHYLLYVRGDNMSSLINIDGDALGEALISLFRESLSSDLLGIYPRIASRYQHASAKAPDLLRSDMKEFLYSQLGISIEAQEMAWSLISGEFVPLPPAPLPPPPPIIVSRGTKTNEPDESEVAALTGQISSHQQKIDQIVRDQFNNLASSVGSQGGADDKKGRIKGTFSPSGSPGITPEQQRRGWIGEEEIKRRLLLPGGWGGFIFVADRRNDGCGYDFLCKKDDKEIKLEIKTFTQNGKVFMTSTEIQEAMSSRDEYFLIGIVDDGSVQGEWKTYQLNDPIIILLEKGEFDIQTRLQISAVDIFEMP